MSRLGVRLAACFMDAAFPTASGELQYAEWEDVQAIFFDLMKMIAPISEMEGRRWTERSIGELDDWLWETAKAGRYSDAIALRPGCGEEMRRRCEYAVIAAGLEEMAGKPLHMPFPSDVPDDAKAFALMLYILGGPARAYRRDLYAPPDQRLH